MKLLLHKDIPKLGYFGDVVEVSEGYARNYLLPQRLAAVPTDSNVKAIEEERALKVEGRRLAREALLKAAEKVNGVEITISANANEQGHLYGSVTEEDVARHLQEDGYEVARSQVVMSEHFNMLGTYKVTLRFSADVSSEIKVWVVRPEGQADESEPEQVPEQSE